MPRQILKQRKDGRYRCKLGNKYFYGSTPTEALRARAAYQRMLDAGMRAEAEGMTVAQYVNEWLPLYKANVTTRTYNDYASQLDKLVEALGGMLLKNVSVDDARALYLRYNGYSNSTIKRARMLYIGLFDAAMENGYCTRNPFRSRLAQPDKGTEGSHRAITDEERKLIHECQHSFRLPVFMMLYAGLRRGEALAIDIDRDIDLHAGVIHVRESVRFEVNQPVVAQTKTEAGNRDVPVFEVLRKELVGKTGLLSPSKHGVLMSESAFSSAWNSYVLAVECMLNGVSQKRWFGRRKIDQENDPERYAYVARLEAAGCLKEADALRLENWKRFTVRPHDLRHSFCTMLRDAGVDLKQAMEWMGHEDEKMILRIYDHVSENRTRASILKVESLIGGQDGGQTADGHSQTNRE